MLNLRPRHAVDSVAKYISECLKQVERVRMCPHICARKQVLWRSILTALREAAPDMYGI